MVKKKSIKKKYIVGTFNQNTIICRQMCAYDCLCKVKNAFNLILNGKFDINPKVIKGECIGCKFCKYQDLCFKTGKDFVYLKED